MFGTHSRQGRRSGHAPSRRPWPMLSLLVLSGLIVQPACSAELTEQAAIEFALSRPAFLQAENARLDIAESAVEQSRLLPNPILELGRERLDATAGRSTESTVHIAQTLDISGRRGLRQQASEDRLSAAQQNQALARLQAMHQTRQQFAETLRLERLQAALNNWLGRIDAAHALVGRLAAAGEASGYDRRRLEREAKAARAQLAATEAELRHARALLAALIGRPLDATERLAGELIPGQPPALDTLDAMTAEHPALASLEAQANAYARERKASQRQWLPELTLGVGSKRISEQGHTDNGVMLSLNLPLPVFDHGQAATRRAQAEESAARAERELLLARSQAELQGLWLRAVQLRQAALDFKGQAETQSRELSTIAEAAYRAGETSILELLDAYRSELGDQTGALDLALRARLARIELDTLTGARHD